MNAVRYIASWWLAAAVATPALACLGGLGCKDREARPSGDDRPAETSEDRSPDRDPERGAGQPDPDDPGHTVLAGIEIDTVAPTDEPPRELYERELAKSLGRQLVGSGVFAAHAGELPDGVTPRPATLQIRMAYRTQRTDRGRASLWLGVSGEITWQDGDDAAPSENVVAERPLTRAERGNLDGVFAAHASATLAEVGRGLIAKETVRIGGSGALASALEQGDVDLVLWSLELIAERRERALFDAVLAALASENTLIRDRALTALVALGDPRAVDALARRASFEDPVFLPQVIEAITALGGDDAREYLEFVASGHPDGDIRSRAREGLERLARRSARPAPTR